MSNSDSSRNLARRSSVPTEQRGVHKIALKAPIGSAGIIMLKSAWLPLLFAINFLFTYFCHSQFETLLGCSLATFMAGLYFILIMYVLRPDFVLTRSGITLPFFFIWKSFGLIHWKWDHLSTIIFARSTPDSTTADQLIIRFHKKTTSKPIDIHIKLTEIDQLDLKKLIYAVITNAPHVVIEPALDKVALEFPTISGIKYLNFNNFTSLWDDEFSTRYSPTLFVPLSPDDKLRNGSITISELVACGGSAAIYAAKDSQGLQIIVKEAVIPKNSPEALKTKALELFNREAFLLSKLNHPNIAKVMDHFVEDEHHYEVIEFIDGLDLRRFVKERGPQPESFVLNWIQQICEILIYLHSQDPPVMHRDLTPDNLVLRVDGQLVLIDFGAANAFVGTATGTMVGKQSYMPPEQLRGKSVPQSDIYALGCTCYFLLTGRDPTPLEVSQVDKDSKLPLTLNPILKKCTAIEVVDRYESAVALLHDIKSIRKQLAET